MGLHKITYGITQDYTRLNKIIVITWDYMEFKKITRDYVELHKITWDYILDYTMITPDCTGWHEIKKDYKDYSGLKLKNANWKKRYQNQ